MYMCSSQNCYIIQFIWLSTFGSFFRLTKFKLKSNQTILSPFMIQIYVNWWWNHFLLENRQKRSVLLRKRMVFQATNYIRMIKQMQSAIQKGKSLISYYNQKINPETVMSSRLNWSIDEQNLLKALKQEQSIKSWKKIAQILNQKFPDSARSGKQCRDRYINYVRFNSQTPKLVSWTPEEDLLLFKKIEQYGAKWVMISGEMPGRSQNNLKNRFYGAIRKIMRKIVKVEKQMKPKPKKNIKQKQIIKIFEEFRKLNKNENFDHEVNSNFSSELHEKLINIAISQQQSISSSQVRTVIDLIHSFSSNKNTLDKKSNQNSSVTGQASRCSLEELTIQQQEQKPIVNNENCLQQSIQLNNDHYNRLASSLMESKDMKDLKDSLNINFLDWPFERDPEIYNCVDYGFVCEEAESFIY